MAENSKIEWCDSTFNPWRGCSRVSLGCKNCYAATMSQRNPKTMGVWGPNGTRVVASESMWKEPLKWDRKAKAAGVRHRVFCASLADVFEDWTGPMVDSTGTKLDHSGVWQFRGNPAYDPLTMEGVRERLGSLIRDTPNLDWLLLTKRPENIIRMAEDHMFGVYSDGRLAWPDNCWTGTSVEDQQTADFRIPHLLKVPAKVRFLSCEPLLGSVDLSEWMYTIRVVHNGDGDTQELPCKPDIHWVITGGESGPGYRDCDPAWQEDIVRQCKAAGVAVFVKQDSAPKSGQRGRIPLDVWQHKESPEVTQ
jgi:protein gp37